jgi:beta-1,4-N-acetylglucosaminyltransferase
MKICLTCSAGGHYTEMSYIENAFAKYDYFYVTIKSELTKDVKRPYYINDSYGHNYLEICSNFFIIFIQSIKIFLKEKPDIIISFGADVTIPICIIGKLFKKKIIYIESLCRIKDISVTGKILYFVVDLFIVQWEELQKKYKKSVFIGRII